MNSTSKKIVIASPNFLVSEGIRLFFNSNGYVKKPINVMQIENLGKLTNIEKCKNFKD